MTARSARETECAGVGDLVWQADLRSESVDPDSLPLTVRSQLLLPPAREAALTVLSDQRMLLVVDEVPIRLQRGTLEMRVGDKMPDTRAGNGGEGGGSKPADRTDASSGNGGSAGSSGVGGPVAGSMGEVEKPAADGDGGAGSGTAGMPQAAGSGTGGASAGSSGSTVRATGGAGAAAGSGGMEPAGRGAGTGAGAGDGGSSGAGTSAPAGGAGAESVPPPDITGRRWHCINLLGSCSCIAHPESEEQEGDCTRKYPCCYTNLDSENVDCICNPEELSGGCFVYSSDSHRPRVDWCPGQSE